MMQALRDDDFLRLNAFSAFIENFAAPSKRERLRFLLSKPTRRAEIPRLFHDGAILDSRCLFPLPPKSQNPAAILRELKRMGAGDACFVLSFEPQFARPWNWEAALDEIWGDGIGAILMSESGKIGYFESEERERAILKA